ncbi:MAG: ABC transporter ATP-binding protein [Eubacteriales bacterium]|nr:ABC transporter ATP-binding protein [Eubacteriales bacterium]
MSLLEITSIVKKFGGLTALNNVSLHIEEGEIVSLIGPNGAGKTTLFNILTGINEIMHGEIIFEGKAIQNKPPQDIVKLGISRTFQNIRLFQNMRVVENVLIGTHINTEYNFFDALFRTKKHRQQEILKAETAIRLLKAIGLEHRMHDYASDLSYGEQRKVEIARALATGCKLILLDEPAAGMNQQESANLLMFIRELRDNGYTVFLIEHDMNVIMNISDRIYVLDYGVMIAEGKPEEIANNPEVIKAYLGGVIEDAVS